MKLRCDFCYHYCLLEDGQVGRCQVRKNQGGRLVTLNYGDLVALAVDPVEKKPLYHYMPGSKTLSLAMAGCNLGCSFCQNYTISQGPFPASMSSRYTESEEVVHLALDSGCPSVSFTYSEPLVWQDYVIDVARKAKKAGLKTIMVSNGTFSEESLERLIPVIDAFNIDLKGDERFYRTLCNGSSKPVIEALRILSKAENKHLEVTTMVMQKEHSLRELEEMKILLGSLGVQIWHLSRYFPNYKSQRKATEESFLQQVLDAVSDGSIGHIYGGNTMISQNTYCPNCRSLLMQRQRYAASKTESFHKGFCTVCGSQIYGCFPS